VPPPRWLWLALAALVWILGLTRAWSQNSGSLSNGSGNDLGIREKLSGQYRTALNGQSEALRQALTELETSRANSMKLTSLLEQSLNANGVLGSYNEQIAERMRRRDEDLAAAYGDITRLEKQRLNLVLAVVLPGGAVTVWAVLKFFIIRRR
jgi:hypothetical protein